METKSTVSVEIIPGGEEAIYPVNNLIKLDKEKSTVEQWIEFSMNPRTENELRQAMLDKYLREHIACVSYICKNSLMSCEFIEEFMALSTGSFDYTNYNEENLKMAIYILSYSPVNKERVSLLLKLIDDNPDNMFLKLFNVNDRIDWYSIFKYQTIEPWFYEKYKNFTSSGIGLSTNSRKEISSFDLYDFGK